MPWSTNTEKQKVESGLTSAAKTTYNTWMKAINSGKDPKTAASSWDSNYEVLVTGSPKKCSVRLAKGDRVYFLQDDSRQIATIIKVGSHKAPAGFPNKA